MLYYTINKMAPSDIFLYSYISTLLSHNHRSLLLKQMGKGTETHS